MIDFLKYRYVCLFASILFLVAGAGAYYVRGGFSYHIDFSGGTEMQVQFEHVIPTSSLRAAMASRGWENPVIQSVGAIGRDFIVRVKTVEENPEERFLKDMKKTIKDNRVIVRNVDWVGAEVGRDIQWNAIKSVILSLFLILLYVAIRSQYRYAVGAVVAIAHDMLAVLIYFLIFNEPISLNVLAAVLAILGYSLNDTIVIFSRVRENLKKMKGMSEEDIVNLSINQTLRRTLLTSFTTFVAVGSIFLIGGQALHGFSLAMLIGIVMGTYSSVYIASPVMLALGGSEK